MTIEFAAFEVSDYLDDEKVIDEYLLAAARRTIPLILTVVVQVLLVKSWT
jgi:hypothetical protein